MALSPEEEKAIFEVAEKFDVKRIWLFGSAAEGDEYDDIDLIVEGVPPELFFKFYGRLGMALDKNVDLFDAAEDIPFIKRLPKTGTVIYAKRKPATKSNPRRAAAYS